MVRDPVSGALVWVCRTDRQVKVRGVRIELEDVERNISRGRWCIGQCAGMFYM